MSKEYQGIPENAGKNTHKKVAEIIKKIGIIGKVLDVPSGQGALTKRLTDNGINVFPADIQNILKFDNTNFEIANMNEKLPYKDGFFDAVICLDGIEHIERHFDFVRECGRVIKQDGIAIITTPNISSLRSRWRWFLTGHHNKCKSPLNELKPNPLHHINMISLPELRYMLHTNGFEIEAATANRIKLISWLFVFWVPIVYFFTLFTYSKEEKNPDQKIKNRQIMKQMFSKDILFGETMIIIARKK